MVISFFFLLQFLYLWIMYGIYKDTEQPQEKEISQSKFSWR